MVCRADQGDATNKEKPRHGGRGDMLFLPPMAARVLGFPPFHTVGEVGGGGVWYLDQPRCHRFRREIVAVSVAR